jgi:3-hydroxyisobutyrate dehydrogenase-like beta-hydroxyacid dehydrogenase
MGRGIGTSLLRAGFPLTVVPNRQRHVADELISLGATQVDSPMQGAGGSDVVVTSLPSAEAVRDVLFGREGVSQAGRGGLLVIECSTLRPADAKEFGTALAERGAAFVDAPVTRGPNEALQGKLNALLGANTEEHSNAASVVLSAFCESIFRMGPVGSGYAAKLVNNFLAFSALAALSEAMATASKGGLDLTNLLEAISVSGGQSRAVTSMKPWITKGQPALSIITVATACKDVAYYLQHAESLQTAGPVTRTVHQQLEQAVAAGLGDALTTAYLSFATDTLGARVPVSER